MQQTRWKQRFENLDKAIQKLTLTVDRLKITPDDEVVAMALIQAFEFCFELSWKTLKDYLKYEGVEEAVTPRQVLKLAFHFEMLDDGALWIDMLENRNLLSHTYDEATAQRAKHLILEKYVPAIHELHLFLHSKLS